MTAVQKLRFQARRALRVESKWRLAPSYRPVVGFAWRPSQRWDWHVLGWWLCGVCLCVAFWTLLGLTLSGINY
jgi:hypothetical protein